MHGVNVWSYSWRNYIEPIAEAGYRVIAVDLPGYGRSDKLLTIDRYSKELYQAWLSELLFDELGISDAIIVGPSFMSDVAARLVVDRRDAFRGMVAIAPTFHDGSNEGMNRRFEDNFALASANAGSGISTFVLFNLSGGLDPDEARAFDAPFPSREFVDGVLSLTGSVEPSYLEHPSADNQRRYWEQFMTWDKPLLVVSSDHSVQADWIDPYLDIPGASDQPHIHFPASTALPEIDFEEDVLDVILEYLGQF